MSEEPRDRRPRELIFTIREAVQQARNQAWSELVNYATVTPETRRQLAERAIQYWDVLAEHDDERVIRDEWREKDIDWVQRIINETVETEVPAAGDSNATRTVQRPKIQSVPARQLIKVTKDLDRMAKKLGFAAEAEQELPHDDISREDLETLLRARGQKETRDQQSDDTAAAAGGD